MEDEPDYESDALDTTIDELRSPETLDLLKAYDPARRRRRVKIFDPRRRKRAMPIALRRYWAARRAADPKRRRRRRARKLLDPTRRRRTRARRRDPMIGGLMLDPRRRRARKRRHDPGIFGIRSPLIAAVAQPIVTTLGGIFHNWLVKKGKVTGAIKVGQVGAVGHLGLIGGAIGAGLDTQSPPSVFGSLANAFGSGMLAEAVNLPSVEGIVTTPTMKAAAGAVGAPSLPGGIAPGLPVGVEAYMLQPHKGELVGGMLL